MKYSPTIEELIEAAYKAAKEGLETTIDPLIYAEMRGVVDRYNCEFNIYVKNRSYYKGYSDMDQLMGLKNRK